MRSFIALCGSIVGIGVLYLSLMFIGLTDSESDLAGEYLDDSKVAASQKAANLITSRNDVSVEPANKDSSIKVDELAPPLRQRNRQPSKIRDLELLAFSDVKLYKLDADQNGLTGELLGRGSTNDKSEIIDLAVPHVGSNLYVVEFVSSPSTIDLNTGEPPITSLLTTVVTQQQLITGAPIHATPLTTLAMKLTQAQISQKSVAGITDFERSAKLITKEFGLVDAPNSNVFESNPIPFEYENKQALMESVVPRNSSLAVSAIIQLLHENSGDSVEKVMDALVEDLSGGY